MTTIVTPFLRNALLLDAAGSAAVGVLLLAAPTWLSDLFDLPRTLLVVVGAGIFGWVALLVLAVRRPALPDALAWFLVLGNAGYVLASFGILVLGIVAPNVLGTAFVVAQALAVALFTLLQLMGLRGRSATA